MSKIKTRLHVMIVQQHKINKYIRPHWWTDNLEWYRAIVAECSEAISYHSWQWWSTKKLDLDKSKMEVVDIFHFGISLSLQKRLSDGMNVSDAIDDLVREAEPYMSKRGLDNKGHIELIEDVQRTALNEKDFRLDQFAALMNVYEMDFDELFRSYVEKSTLNVFRNEHGYQTGRYTKIWGQGDKRASDNEYLMQIRTKLDRTSPHYPSALYDALEATYKNLVRQ